MPANLLERAEGVVKVVETSSHTITVEKAIKFMGTEVEMDTEFWELKKKRRIKSRKSPGMCVNWSLDLTVSFKLLDDGQKTVNEAEVFLLPEELPIFTRTLIEHPVLLPISYAQQLSMERGMHCIRLTSQEPFKDFAGRLSEALYALG